MKRFRLALAATALLLSGPLLAQPAHPLDCPLEGVSTEQRALAGSAASQRLTDGPADGVQRGGAALDAVLANLSRCAGSRRLTEAQRIVAEQYVLMQLAREDMFRRYAAQHVDLGFLDEAVVRPETAPSFDDLAARLRAQGVSDDRPDSPADIVYLYLTMAYRMGEIRASFDNPDSTMR